VTTEGGVCLLELETEWNTWVRRSAERWGGSGMKSQGGKRDGNVKKKSRERGVGVESEVRKERREGRSR